MNAIRPATPPHGAIINITKDDLRTFGTNTPAIRVKRALTGRWRVVPRALDAGYIVFLRDCTAEDVPNLPNDLRVQIVDTRKSSGLADLCNTK